MATDQSPPPSSPSALAGLSRGATLAQQAAHAIAAAIDDGQLKPGERLVELKLAETFRISRGPLREALKMLEAQGIVERRGSGGSFVSNPSVDFIAHAVILRGMIEGLGARFAAVGDHEQVMPALEEAYWDMSRAAGENDRTSFFKAHREFHMVLCDSAGSAFLSNLSQSIRAQIELHVRRSGMADVGFEGILANHRLFMDAVRSRDPARAEATIRNLIIESGFRTMKRPIPEAIKDLWAR
jgi:DNA-binding GntR family transcriptional regulator